MGQLWYGSRRFDIADESAVAFYAVALKMIREGKTSSLSFKGDDGPEVCMVIGPGVLLHIETDEPLTETQRLAVNGDFEIAEDAEGRRYLAVSAAKAADESE